MRVKNFDDFMQDVINSVNARVFKLYGKNLIEVAQEKGVKQEVLVFIKASSVDCQYVLSHAVSRERSMFSILRSLATAHSECENMVFRRIVGLFRQANKRFLRLRGGSFTPHFTEVFVDRLKMIVDGISTEAVMVGEMFEKYRSRLYTLSDYAGDQEIKALCGIHNQIVSEIGAYFRNQEEMILEALPGYISVEYYEDYDAIRDVIESNSVSEVTFPFDVSKYKYRKNSMRRAVSSAGILVNISIGNVLGAGRDALQLSRARQIEENDIIRDMLTQIYQTYKSRFDNLINNLYEAIYPRRNSFIEGDSFIEGENDFLFMETTMDKLAELFEDNTQIN